MKPNARENEMKAYEEMSLHAWPSLETSRYKGCIYRVSNGYTNRSNSANPLYSQQNDNADLVTYAEMLYKKNNLPCVFKVLDHEDYKDLDALLAQKQYEKINASKVMTLESLSEIKSTHCIGDFENHFTKEWFSAYTKIHRIPEAEVDVAYQIHASIQNTIIASSIQSDDEIVACSFGAVENGYIGLFDIAVNEHMRRKGLGRALVEGILHKAKESGVKKAYLQVTDSNEIAKQLYGKIGFTPNYSYWYRRKSLTTLCAEN